MSEPRDVPPETTTVPLGQRGTDRTAGGADSSPHDTEPPSGASKPPGPKDAPADAQRSTR